MPGRGGKAKRAAELTPDAAADAAAAGDELAGAAQPAAKERWSRHRGEARRSPPSPDARRRQMARKAAVAKEVRRCSTNTAGEAPGRTEAEPRASASLVRHAIYRRRRLRSQLRVQHSASSAKASSTVRKALKARRAKLPRDPAAPKARRAPLPAPAPAAGDAKAPAKAPAKSPAPAPAAPRSAAPDRLRPPRRPAAVVGAGARRADARPAPAATAAPARSRNAQREGRQRRRALAAAEAEAKARAATARARRREAASALSARGRRRRRA